MSTRMANISQPISARRPVLSLDTADDHELCLAIRDRSDAALAETYRRHSAAVFGLARRLTHNRSLAEDVVQEVFVRLWNNPTKFDPARGSLRSFLLAHTHGRSIDIIRSESSRRRREDNEATLTANAGPSIDEEVWQLTLADKVQQTLTSLPETERSVIELAYFGGLTYREVAAHLDLPEGTVKSRIRSGLKRLKLRMAEAGLGSV